MKKIITVAAALLLSAQLFASHYNQKGDITERESEYTVRDSKLLNMPSVSTTGFYQFSVDCAGLAKENSGLLKTGTDQYISESGRTHEISEIFAKYETRVRSVGDADLSFRSREDADVMVVVEKNGAKYTIDIYTGADAHQLVEIKK